MPRKPMAAATRVGLFEREIRWKLSAAAIDILFDAAHVLTEGETLGGSWSGSTMITIDLPRAQALVRDDCDAQTARRVAALLAEDPRARVRARELAAAEAADRAGSRLSRVDVDMRVRASGARVHVDLDVEGDVARAAVQK